MKKAKHAPRREFDVNNIESQQVNISKQLFNTIYVYSKSLVTYRDLSGRCEVDLSVFMWLLEQGAELSAQEEQCHKDK